MSVKKSVIPFSGTEEQEKLLHGIIEQHRHQAGALMPVLQKAQELYGYLPIEVQNMIADGLKVPKSQVYGVVSFYAQFTLNPKGRNQIQICLGTACYVKGAGNLLDRLSDKLGIAPGGITPDGKFSLDECRCFGACGLAPVVIVNGEVYGRLKSDDIDGILGKYE
ncbi:NADH-quinone oxidoreductase subunit NuoE family protein [Parasporobacterium paucivorans]|uniref:NAD(P)-dependent iron-only hydrogenase diaphorase component iron-sulfur protein n=1 Tax=Parasporobacterium paucivorans DSM 15970 TaxID=1122934 RepID=A0A1M6A0I8_9FIRM|nr:NAD(P)H-dependent oxidoreductase subunit E [Parasporobacterium paucivorans]SHI30044.1 NAD(P)-dependent iron-only hydrogenase diaphorase component iron-sulfur protein [Parasporobacterium paucivorans DSM 15970]